MKKDNENLIELMIHQFYGITLIQLRAIKNSRPESFISDSGLLFSNNKSKNLIVRIHWIYIADLRVSFKIIECQNSQSIVG